MKLNTLNIPNVYDYLKKPHQPSNEKNVYNSADDHVIRYMKNSGFYKELSEAHGNLSVEEREFFLSN